MSTSADRSRVEKDSGAVAALAVLTSTVDVPGLLADRIGDLYAAEERRLRNQRTERMILKAQSLEWQTPAE